MQFLIDIDVRLTQLIFVFLAAGLMLAPNSSSQTAMKSSKNHFQEDQVMEQ